VIGSFESPEITPLQVYAPPLPETREKFEEFVFGRFCIALDSPGRYAGATEDRFEFGLASIQKKYLPETQRDLRRGGD